MKALCYLILVCFPKGHSVAYLLSTLPIFSAGLVKTVASVSQGLTSNRQSFIIVTLTLFSCFIYSLVYGAVLFVSNSASLDFIFDPFRYLCYLLMFFLGLTSVEKDRESFLKAIKYIVILNLILVFLQKALGVYMYTPFSMRSDQMIAIHYLKRVIGTLGNPNILGAYFSSLALFFFLSFYSKDKKGIILFLAALVIVMLSQSRTALMFLILGLAFILLQKRKLKPLLIIISAVPIMVFYLYSSGLLNYIVNGYLTVLDKGLMAQSSFSARVEYWEVVVNVTDDNWLFGVGYPLGAHSIKVTDNAYLYSIAKYGVFGLLYWFSIFFLFIELMFKAMKRNHNCYVPLAMCFGYAIITTSLLSDMGENLILASSFFLYSGIAISGERKHGQP